MTHPPLALVLTPVASGPALAGLCAMSGIDVHVVPSRAGAVAALELTPEPAEDGGDEWDIATLLGGPEAVPRPADQLARSLSRLAKTGVVLLTATLAPSDDAGELTGQLTARRYAEGEPGEEIAVGLLLAGAEDVVEDLILRRVAVAEVPGHQRSGEMPRWKAARLFAKGLRRRH